MEFEVKPFIYTTKMKALLQILLLTVAFTGCQNHGAKKADLSSADSILVDSLFKKYQKESKQYIFMYQTTSPKHKEYLDSALYLVEEAIEKGYSKLYYFELGKLGILAEMGEYDKAVEYVYSLNKYEYIKDYPYLIVIKNRFKAMQCHAKNDKEGEKKYLHKIVSIIKTYIDKHKKEILEYLQSDDPQKLSKGDYMMAVATYCQYTMLLYREGKAQKELEELSSAMSSIAKQIFMFPPKEDDLKGFYGY